jgi:hypothetical protein
MIKLTKEQAKWLIEKLDKGIGNEENLVCSEIVEIIELCTESEFPMFAIFPYEKHEVEANEELSCVQVTLEGFDYSAPIGITEFEDAYAKIKNVEPLNRLNMIWNGLCGCLHDAKYIEDDAINAKEIIRRIEYCMEQVRLELLSDNRWDKRNDRA